MSSFSILFRWSWMIFCPCFADACFLGSFPMVASGFFFGFFGRFSMWTRSGCSAIMIEVSFAAAWSYWNSVSGLLLFLVCQTVSMVSLYFLLSFGVFRMMWLVEGPCPWAMRILNPAR